MHDTQDSGVGAEINEVFFSVFEFVVVMSI